MDTSAPETFAITVTAVNAAPTAIADSYSTPEETTLTVAAPGLLSNDGDGDGDAITAAVVAQPTHGTLTLNIDGSFSYTPAVDFTGDDSFTYQATDPSGATSPTTTVSIEVTAVNDAPAAVDDFATVAEDTPLTIHALANDSDAEGGQLSSTLVDPTANGTVVHNADGSFTYTPNANFSGTDRFTYKASDGVLESGVATVTITVTPTNDAPAAAADSYTADEDKQLTVAAPGVLANDVDVDAGQILRATLVTGPANGTLILNENGSFTYTPKTHFSGSDAFTYSTTDGIASSSAVTVTITVKPRMTVTLDIIPGSSTNSIGYSSSQTEIVFAIVSSATFDATLVNPATVTLGDEKGTDTPIVRNADGSFKFLLTDVNGDGRKDFYAYVNKEQMKANGDLTLTTTSMTVLGGLKAPRTELFRGKDKVNVVK